MNGRTQPEQLHISMQTLGCLIPHLKMPHQPTATEIHLNNIVAYLTPTVTLLKELNDAFGPPFIQTISNTVETLISIAQVGSFQDTHTFK
jgi:hypothetical protein